MLHTGALIDGRDEVAREHLDAVLAIAFGCTGAGLRGAEVDDGNARRVVVVVVPAVDVPTEILQAFEQWDQRTIDHPAPGHDLVALALVLHARFLATGAGQGGL